MGALEIIVIIMCVLIVFGVIAKSVIEKKKGKNACGCSCAHCKYANKCSSSINNKK